MIDAWKKLVVLPVADLLKRHGFRKSGLNFSAARSGLTLLVSLQSSTGSSNNSLKVTCNLGIIVDRLANGPNKGMWNSHWRQRIGFFLPEPRDHWWECASDDEARRAGEEIATLLAANALPVVEQLATPVALSALWSSGHSPGLTDNQRVEYLSQLMTGGDVSAASGTIVDGEA